MVVGWYHSHPGFGCWLSSVDINTQQVLTHLRLSAPPYLLVYRSLSSLLMLAA